MSLRRCSRRALLGALGASAAAFAGCAAPADPAQSSQSAESTTDADPSISLSVDAGWTTYGYTAGHTGHNPSASDVGGDPTQVWERFVDGIYTLREPAVADGRLFVGSGESMWAFDAATGEDEWDTDLGALHHPPRRHAARRRQAVRRREHRPPGLRARARPRGRQPAVAYRPPNHLDGCPRRRPPLRRRQGGRARLRAGARPRERRPRLALRRARRPRSYILGTPAYADGTLYVTATHLADDGRTSGALYALDPENGEVSWSLSTDAALPFAPIVADGLVHLVGRDGTVQTVSTDGERGWSADAGADVYTRPTYADGRLFVLTVDDIVAYDEGEADWRAASDRTQLTGMAVGGGTLYVGGEPLFALDIETGGLLFDLDEDVFHLTYGAPIVVDDVLYAGICIKDEPGAMYDNSVRAFV